MVCLFINYLRGVIVLIEIIDLRRDGVFCNVKMAQYLGNGDRVEISPFTKISISRQPRFVYLKILCDFH